MTTQKQNQEMEERFRSLESELNDARRTVVNLIPEPLKSIIRVTEELHVRSVIARDRAFTDWVTKFPRG